MNTTRKPTREELENEVKGLYWHPVHGWLIDEPNVTTPLVRDVEPRHVAYTVQWGD